MFTRTRRLVVDVDVLNVIFENVDKTGLLDPETGADGSRTDQKRKRGRCDGISGGHRVHHDGR